MANIGTTFTKSGKKAVLCGSGELGKEVAIELQRYGVEVVALDKYANAPAMHIAHSSHVLSMLDGEALKSIIKDENRLLRTVLPRLVKSSTRLWKKSAFLVL